MGSAGRVRASHRWLLPPQVVLPPPTQAMMTLRVVCSRRVPADIERRAVRSAFVASPPGLWQSVFAFVDLTLAVLTAVRVAPAHLVLVKSGALGLPPPGELGEAA